MGVIVIACYRPKPGREAELDRLVGEHLPLLRAENLVTGRASIAGRAADGAVVEIFEWKDREAMAAAHENPRVGELWGRFADAADFLPVAEVPGAGELFTELEPLPAGG